MLASSRTSLVAFAHNINPQPTLASSHTSSHSHRTFTPSGHSVRLHTLTARQRQGQGPSLPLLPSSTRTIYPPLRTAPHTAPTRLCLTQLQCKQNDNDNAPDTSTQCDQNPLNTTNIDTDRNTDRNTDFDTSIKENLNNTLKIPPEVIELYNQFKQFKNPIPGIQIGLPLNLFAQIFTQHRYGENIMGPKDIFLQCCIGYFTYGLDRLLDAEEAKGGVVSESKKARYKAIEEHRDAVIAAIASSGIYTLTELNKSPETRPFIPLLASTVFYKQIKSHFGPVKPFYLSAMWALSTTVLPSVMHDHNFSVLASPQDYLPAALLLFGTTNLVDIRDYEEDKANGVNSLPTTIGKNMTLLSSAAALALFAIMMN